MNCLRQWKDGAFKISNSINEPVGPSKDVEMTSFEGAQ